MKTILLTLLTGVVFGTKVIRLPRYAISLNSTVRHIISGFNVINLNKRKKMQY